MCKYLFIEFRLLISSCIYMVVTNYVLHICLYLKSHLSVQTRARTHIFSWYAIIICQLLYINHSSTYIPIPHYNLQHLNLKYNLKVTFMWLQVVDIQQFKGGFAKRLWESKESDDFVGVLFVHFLIVIVLLFLMIVINLV